MSSRPTFIYLTRLAVAGSFLLNVGLLSLLALSSWQPGSQGNGVTPAIVQTGMESGTLRLPELQRYGGYKAYYEALRARGLSHEESKPVIISHLEREARRAAAVSDSPYWQPRDTSQLEFPLRLSAELDHVRTVLTAVYGTEAARDPEFAAVFQPLGPEFSFLSSKQQVEIQRLKLEQQLAAVSASVSSMQWPKEQRLIRAGEPPEDPPIQSMDMTPILVGMLEADTLLEYQLRESPLAEQLRNSKVDFSEKEFRQTFTILTRLEHSMGDRSLYAEARSTLRTLLGGRRFAQIWASRDPLFGIIEQSCKQHSLTEETVLTVYEIFNDSQDRLIEAARAAVNDPQRGAERAREERANIERRLSGLLGSDVAKDILRAQTQYMLSLTRIQPPIR